MSKSLKFKVHFFKAELSTGSRSLKHYLDLQKDNLKALHTTRKSSNPDDNSPIAIMSNVDSRRCGLYQVKEMGVVVGPDAVSYIAGRVGYIDTSGMAPKIGDNIGNEKIVPLPEKWGVLYDTHFAFFPETNVLAVQFVKIGLKAKHVSSIFEDIFEVEQVLFTQLFSKNAIKQLQTFGRIRGTSFTVAKMEANSSWVSENGTLEDFVSEGNEVGAGKICVEYNASRGQSLGKRAAMAFYDKMRELGSVTRAKIFGENDKEIDLIKQRIYGKGQVDIVNHNVNSEHVYEELASAYSTKRNEIISVYGTTARE